MRERLRVPVYYDFASTICYVAHRVLGRLEEPIAELGIELDWRPLDLTRIVQRPRGAALPEAARANAERVARELAVPARVPPRWLDSRPAAAAALAIDDPARRATWRERVFTAAFEEHLDIGAAGAVSAWLEALGFAVPTAAIERGLAELETETERAREAQVSGVPTLMLGEWPIGGIQDERTTLHLLGRYARKRSRPDG
jgi:predicted DsbA family dithiol-disulfide isomerase